MIFNCKIYIIIHYPQKRHSSHPTSNNWNQALKSKELRIRFWSTKAKNVVSPLSKHTHTCTEKCNAKYRPASAAADGCAWSGLAPLSPLHPGLPRSQGRLFQIELATLDGALLGCWGRLQGYLSGLDEYILL